MPSSMSRTCSRQYFSRRPEAERRRAAAAEHADHAVGGLEALLHVQRLPRAALFVLGEGNVVVGVVVAERAHEGLAGHRAALQVLRQQAVGAADRRVGVVVRTHRADARSSCRSRGGSDRSPPPSPRPSSTCCRAPTTSEAASARITGKYSGRAPGHHRVHRDLLDRVFPLAAIGGRLHRPTTSSGAWLVCASIAATRSSVGSTIGSLSVQLLLEEEFAGVRLRCPALDEARRRALSHARPRRQRCWSAPRRSPASPAGR